MKIVITLVSMVLMVRGSYCAVIYATDGGTNAALERASSSTSSSNSSSESSNENPLQNMVKCFKADSLLKCFNDRVGLLVRFWREALLNSVRRNGNDNLHWSQSLEYTLRDLGKAIYYGITTFFQRNDDGEARSALDNTESSDTSIDSRGHHKKKKVHKEIKKIVLKIIIAIFLKLIKIKMLLGMLQSIVITKFVVTATILVLTIVFKIWYELKLAKQHHKEHDKSIIYYDNTHDHHTYDLPEHDLSGGHDDSDHSSLSSSWGGLWGRSYAPTQMPAVTSSSAFQAAYRRPWPYHIRPKVEGHSDPDEFS